MCCRPKSIYVRRTDCTYVRTCTCSSRSNQTPHETDSDWATQYRTHIRTYVRTIIQGYHTHIDCYMYIRMHVRSFEDEHTYSTTHPHSQLAWSGHSNTVHRCGIHTKTHTHDGLSGKQYIVFIPVPIVFTQCRPASGTQLCSHHAHDHLQEHG